MASLGWKGLKSFVAAGKRTAVWISPTCECLLLLYRGRILKSERSLMDKSLVCFVSHSKNDSDLSPSSFLPWC
jgi:hypothetical protein